MTTPITGAGAGSLPQIPLTAFDENKSAAPVSFQGMLLDSLSETNALQQDAQSAIEKSLTGGDITQVEVVSAVKKADMALRLMMQIRNKLYDAYQEVQQIRM
ncbi:MAG: flagellar hook-basal body complex protein FliE [Planctomycetaceae bacterium]